MVFMKMQVIFNWSYSAFWMSVVKPKPKQLSRPIEFSQEPKENSQEKQTNCQKRGKNATKSQLVLVLNLIGSESGASSLGQSHSEVKQKRCNPGYPRHSVENYSHSIIIHISWPISDIHLSIQVFQAPSSTQLQCNSNDSWHVQRHSSVSIHAWRGWPRYKFRGAFCSW